MRGPVDSRYMRAERRRSTLATTALTFALHLVAQIWAANASGIGSVMSERVPSAAAGVLWLVLSFPSFFFAPGEVQSSAFWPLCVVNSALWALAAFLLMRQLRGRHEGWR